MRLILLHEFPEHYGEVLSTILKGSESQTLSLDVWRDLLGTLSGKSKSAVVIHLSKIRDEIRHYATEQRLLSRQEVNVYLFIYLLHLYKLLKKKLMLNFFHFRCMTLQSYLADIL